MPLVRMAYYLQIYRYVVHMVAHACGKTATFMPKPVLGDNASGMHVHQSIWKDDKPLFAGNGYADLSEIALYYIGGISHHARAINAFSNPTTNSYQPLVPGFEAPVLLASSARNRPAGCRTPSSSSPARHRVAVRPGKAALHRTPQGVHALQPWQHLGQGGAQVIGTAASGRGHAARL